MQRQCVDFCLFGRFRRLIGQADFSASTKDEHPAFGPGARLSDSAENAIPGRNMCFHPLDQLGFVE